MNGAARYQILENNPFPGGTPLTLDSNLPRRMGSGILDLSRHDWLYLRGCWISANALQLSARNYAAPLSDGLTNGSLLPVTIVAPLRCLNLHGSHGLSTWWQEHKIHPLAVATHLWRESQQA
jgi:hypothetical protein